VRLPVVRAQPCDGGPPQRAVPDVVRSACRRSGSHLPDRRLRRPASPGLRDEHLRPAALIAAARVACALPWMLAIPAGCARRPEGEVRAPEPREIFGAEIPARLTAHLATTEGA